MAEKRIQFNNIVRNQLPSYIKEEFPLISEFLSQYYISQEFQSAPIDLIQNIDNYIKLDEIKYNSDSTVVFKDVNFVDDVVNVSSTIGFPESYGLLKIDDEIITYTGTKQNSLVGTANIAVGSTICYYSGLSQDYLGRRIVFEDGKILDSNNKILKDVTVTFIDQDHFTISKVAITSTSVYGYNESNNYKFEVTNPQFTGCVRGFSGISSYISETQPEQLVFSKTESANHLANSIVINLNSLFLKEFLLKIKHQLTPGFESRSLKDNLNQYLFIKQAKDFYKSKGTDESFKILFKILYGEDVNIIRPKEYLFKPSDAYYQITKDLVVEPIEGNPENLLNSTLFQKEYVGFTSAYAPISKVEKITSKDGKEYYKLSIDANYDRDIRVDGAIYGEFKIHPQTKVIGNYDINSTIIDVDSTIGFPESGELSVIYSDGSSGSIFYTSKSITQFFGCSNISNTIEDSSTLSLNVFAYGNSLIDQNEVIKVRITSVLNDIDIIDDTFYQQKNYRSKIKTLGINPKDVISNNWLFNVATKYDVLSIELIDSSSSKYEITTTSSHIFRVGDTLKIKNNFGIEKDSVVIDVLSDKSFVIGQQGDLSITDTYTVQRTIAKTNIPAFPNTSALTANVQNVYKNKDKTLVASPSLPYYGSQSLDISLREIIFSGFFNSNEFKITDFDDHGFYTGDAVYYTPQKSGDLILSKIFNEGIYFIYRVNKTTVKFARSKWDIYEYLYKLRVKNVLDESKFISVDSPVQVTSNKIELFAFKNKTLNSQKLLREISEPVNDGGVYITEPGFTGMLINGVEILNYKSRDVIYFGELERVDVISSGNNYDVIHPPVLTISDPVGLGASAFCSVSGSLNEIKIIDPGFDYQETPIVKITGGNGVDAKASVNMKLVDHESTFNSEINSFQVSIDNNSIGFTTFHKFRNAERVIYKTNNQRSVGGLSTDSSYYVSVPSATEIKLHKTLNDAVVGINTIQLTSFGIGDHSFKSFNKKSIIGSINVENSGSGYENKKRTVLSTISGINTSINQITITNHGYETGEIVKYTTSGTQIGGLVNNNEYYITAIDADNFKLSEIGTGLKPKNFFLNTKQYIDLSSLGSGTHTFNYPEISVELIGNVNGDAQFKALIEPIFRGEITSVHLESNGVGYGSSDILNYNKQPEFRLNSGSGAQVTPIISDGKIVDILINLPGKDYNSIPDIQVNGDGIGAVLTPIIENGKLVDIEIIESGIGYSSSNTSISIIPAGSSAEFFAKIQTWNVNLFEKYLPLITQDDGVLTEGLNEKYELEYAHLYAPRKLREIIYANDQDGNVLYGREDLRKSSNREIVSTNHSPIIGWAYDGNPIYGPYGYSSIKGEKIVQIKSGYKQDLKPNRPSLTQFPVGFFVEDYSYFNVSDESVLDEHNGRFCVTPEFPNGIYAYFATISDLSAETSGTFSGYKKPQFPFFIGNRFKSKPNEFNFKKLSTQVDIDLNETDWRRNTTPYNLTEGKNSYSYLELPNDLDQSIDTTFASPGYVENIDIVSGGSKYRIGDKIIFDNEGTSGYNASAEVERISGKSVESISIATTSIFNVEFYPSENAGYLLAFCENPHNLENSEKISVAGFNTTSSQIEGSYDIKIQTNKISLNTSVGSTSVTGIVTYFSVSGDLNYPNIRENDILKIGSEKVKVLNVDSLSSRIRVLRAFDGSVGSAHSATDVLYEVPRKLIINNNIKTKFNFGLNRELYFNPTESLGLGTTILFSNPGSGIKEIFVPERSIYIPNHGLQTGDELVYSPKDGSSIGVSTSQSSSSFTLSDQSLVYVAKFTDDFIGISTFKVGLGTQGNFVGLTTQTKSYGLLYFDNYGSGKYHSFKTTYNTLKGNIFKNVVTVLTAESHGLSNNDVVFIDVNPSISTTVVLKYSDIHRKILIDPVNFGSSSVNIGNNTITINDHGFSLGQKVVYTSSSPSIGLQNNKEYYVFIVDKNTIKLTNSYYYATNINPEVVDIGSASAGTLSKVNPQINAYRDSKLIFDVSDSSLGYTIQSSSYSAFDLKFFKDSNFTEFYNSDENDSLSKIQRVGSVGVTSDAKIILTINEKTPENIYYSLVPVYDNNLPEIKKLVNADDEVISNNQIKVQSSKYNGKHNVVSTSTSSFTYNTSVIPESISYSSNVSEINYQTNSLFTNGSISKIKITNKGQNYYSLPTISSVNSSEGTDAILKLSSTSIGKIKKTRLNSIGFNFPSDFTLKPSVSIPQVVKIDPLSSLDSVEISSFGKGYTVPPKLLLIDGKTNQVVPEVDLKFILGDKKVQILNNVFGLNPVTPTILPIQNPNGVGISNIEFDETTKDVIVTLSVAFSDQNEFPFSVNDKVLIENVSVINENDKGFNSENYNYQLFTVTNVYPNIGVGFGSVTYNLSEFLNEYETLGIFDPTNSSGRIIPEKHFPTFEISLKKNDYLKYETVVSNSATGYIEDWDSKNNIAKIISKDVFGVDELIKGLTSRSQGIILSVDNFNAFLNLGALSKFENGWMSEVGFLNNNIQRIQDSFYYQNFSYSLKSRVDFDTWDDVVSTLNHTSGFKKFSDYQLETKPDDQTSLNVKLPSDETSIQVISDIISVMNLNCVYDFDLVTENALRINNKVFSDEIYFSNRVLTDYSESIGNRVLSIDDISPQFNSNPRPTNFSEVHRFNLSDVRVQKYITYVRDKRFTKDRQLLIVTTLNDDIGNTYINQYARVESRYDMGSFDLFVDGSEGVLRFYPTKFVVNDFYITTLSYNIDDNLSSIGSTSFGDSVYIQSNSSFVSPDSNVIVSLATTYRSSKLLVSIAADDGQYEFDELSIVHDGSDVYLLEYGQLTNNSLNSFGSSGIGTYYPYISGSQIIIDFIPNNDIRATVNTIQVSFSDTISAGIGTYDMKHSSLQGRSTNISSSASPSPIEICNYSSIYDAAYLIIQISDNTNNKHEILEVSLIDNDTDVFIVEYGDLSTSNKLGTIDAYKTSTSIIVTFTPNPNISVNVKTYLNALRNQDDEKDVIDFLNSEIQTYNAIYEGTERDIKRTFNLTHKGEPIFERIFAGNDPSIVSVASSTITIPNHFFVTGELIKYDNGSDNSSQSIGIAATSFAGIGLTDKLPSEVFVVKLNQNTIKFARSAEDALNPTPKTLNITNVGIGSIHRLVSNKQNSKVLVAIDNVIQSPVVSTAITSTLVSNVFTTDDIIYLSKVTSLFSGDLIQIQDEIMLIESIGIGSTNAIQVRRPWLGTSLGNYPSGTLSKKVNGDYNIVDNKISFVTAPYGNIPFSSSTNSPDERDWQGVSSRSKFQGRSFMRSGVKKSSDETYSKNYIFDSLSKQFNGISKQFKLTSNGNSITDIEDNNGIVLINDIFQSPGISNNYTITEASGNSYIDFTGNELSVPYDTNTASIPRGGIIISVGSSEGLGYQPLVSAGGTATVSVAGTISSISIGNSGSGYRKGLQVVNVGVVTSDTGTPSIQFIGTATVSNGYVVSVAVTNPGSGYTSTNPPLVVFDAPLPYSNIPLIYSSSSSGLGTEARINIVVGQGSNIIDFEIINNGYGYSEDQILTIPTGGLVGIPTTGLFKEFQISVQQTISDKFAGWSIGELQVFDKLDNKFNNRTTKFPLTVAGNLVSIRSAKGSNINVQDTLLVFINDILQVPGEGYVFNGGSIIRFTEPPKVGDTSKILFYKGTKSVDVRDVDILETVKVGDDLVIGYDSSLKQSPTLQENPRSVTSIDAIDITSTNPYFGPGNTLDENLERPVVWCRQTEDKIIDGQEVGKSRQLYEPLINPVSYVIQPVGIGSTIIYVDTIRPFFDQKNENNVSLEFQNKITFVSQDSKSRAIATAVVSGLGTISSVSIIDEGSGYKNATVSFASTIGVSTSTQALGSVIINDIGNVVGVAITNPGVGYTSSKPPIVLISPPESTTETNNVLSFEGDSGIIVGFGITTELLNKFIFDFYIPQNSFLRNSTYVSASSTISSINVNDYFVVYNSNVGSATTNFSSFDNKNNVIGVCTNYIDNVYQVDSILVTQTNVIGIGVTYVKRIYARISSGIGSVNFSSSLITFDSTSSQFTFDNINTSTSDVYTGIVSTSNYFGNFTWGKIILEERSEQNKFNFYGDNGITGIKDSTIVKRTNPLKYKNYKI